MVCFQTKNSNLGKFWRAFEFVGIFYDHLEYFMAIWYNLWPFGIVCDNLVYFTQFGMFGPRKIWQPWSALPTFVGGLVRKWRATKITSYCKALMI
jgi:hypothetical protein